MPTELDGTLVALLPIQLGTKPPPGALAWIDLNQNLYCARLDQVTRKGRHPRAGTEALYEVTTQVVSLALMPPLTEALQRHVPENTGCDWLPLGELLDIAARPPREAVAGQGPYRLTARKFQRSLGGKLVERGHGRWPAAMATQQSTLVAESTEFYSAIPAAMVDAANRDLHELLHWPPPPELPTARAIELIGSRVTLRMDGARLIFKSVVDAANAAPMAGRFSAITRSLNCHAAALSLVMALCLALRDWGMYELSPRRLCTAREIGFTEKLAHPDPESPVPVVDLLRDACAGWCRLLDSAISQLLAAGDDRSVALAHKMLAMRAREDGMDRAFVVGRDLDLHPVGHQTWVSRLPRKLRVYGNVFRHFWPLRLHLAGLPQLSVDVLMRHQLAALHAGTAHIVGTPAGRRQALVSKMEAVIYELELRLPRAFGSEAP